MIERFLNWAFVHEEINGHQRCPTYLHRWTLFQPRARLLKPWLRGFGIYLHKFVGDDWSYDLHDHPKRFISIGLKGSYVEETPSPAMIDLLRKHAGTPLFYDCGCTHLKVDAGLCDVYSNLETEYVAPWVRTFPARHVHRIKLLDPARSCWTLVIVLRTVRDWGFWNRGRWVHWREYVDHSNELADSRKACP
jgi:hypothetical protein